MGPNNWGQCGFDLDNREYRMETEGRSEPAVLSPKPHHHPDLRHVIEFASGEHHSLVLLRDGRVFGFGRVRNQP